MVRLVFRPYTHVWRTICTSVSLRTSTRISPGFILHKHSSPSFGSQHTCSGEECIIRRITNCQWCPEGTTDRFLCAQEFATRRLAHMLDSLVRVSRRVGWQRCNGVRMHTRKQKPTRENYFNLVENRIDRRDDYKRREYDPILQSRGKCGIDG